MGVYWAIVNDTRREYLQMNALTGWGDKIHTFGHPDVGRALAVLLAEGRSRGWPFTDGEFSEWPGRWVGDVVRVVPDSNTSIWDELWGCGYEPAYRNVTVEVLKVVRYTWGDEDQ